MVAIIGVFLLSFFAVVGLAYVVLIGRAYYLDAKEARAEAKLVAKGKQACKKRLT